MKLYAALDVENHLVYGLAGRSLRWLPSLRRRPYDSGVARGRFLLSLPERLLRAGAALLGGAVHETGSLLLPRLVRRSRLYEATAANLLRISIELIGGVVGARTERPEATVGRIAVRKGAGNVVELGSIAAFGFSPLWLLAGASDVLHGSRVYLNVLVAELREAGVVGEELDVHSVDDLLRALEEGSGGTARMIDIPPVELAGLRASLAELRGGADALPSPGELAALFDGLRQTAERERRPLLEVSTGVGLAFLTSARTVSREHLLAPYREDLQPLRDEGFAAYARRVGRPYAEAVSSHFDPGRVTWTERGLDRLSQRESGSG
jgi:hypothetical protein